MPAPVAIFPFAGWKASFFGDAHALGKDGVRFYTETKVVAEVPRFFGTIDRGRVTPAPIAVSATCTRVPVLEGHTLAVSAGLRATPSREEICEAFRSFRGEPQRLRLPSAPQTPVVLREEEVGRECAAVDLLCGVRVTRYVAVR